MKVLLLGEFSSLHKYLKEGLLEIGVDTRIVANGDGWKKIGGNDDILYCTKKKGIVGYSAMCLDAYKRFKKFSNYDVVQLIKPCLYPRVINNSIIKKISNVNSCLSMVAAGDDYALTEAYHFNKFDYFVFDYDVSTLNKYSKITQSGRCLIEQEKNILNYVDIVIPSLYEYRLGYEKMKNVANVIPFPINTNSITYSENQVNKKVVFFHGLNRELTKGTAFIREALQKLQAIYPNEIEVIIDGHMPFDKYVNVMKRANVVIDQCCSYGYGINACIAMAQGKVVVTGRREETLQAFGLDDAPIFPAKPDVDFLFEQLQYIVENKKKIPGWGYESRKYVENVHHYVKVAEKYIEAWKSTGKI